MGYNSLKFKFWQGQERDRKGQGNSAFESFDPTGFEGLLGLFKFKAHRLFRWAARPMQFACLSTS